MKSERGLREREEEIGGKLSYLGNKDIEVMILGGEGKLAVRSIGLKKRKMKNDYSGN